MLNRDTIKRLICIATSVSLLGFAATAFGADSGASLYSQRCESCHGIAGKGDGPAGKYLSPKPTDFATSLKGKTDAWIAKSIKGGGTAVGESATMPPYSDLSDAQVTALVAYIKHLGH